jgi:hypothetical protein
MSVTPLTMHDSSSCPNNEESAIPTTRKINDYNLRISVKILSWIIWFLLSLTYLVIKPA